MMGAAYILRSFALTYIYILELHGWRLDGLPDLDGIPAAIEIILAPASLVRTETINFVMKLVCNVTDMVTNVHDFSKMVM